MSVASTESMAKDDDKGLDEHTRIGVTPPKLPGAVPAAPAAPPADEHTQLGAKPPPIGPRLPAPPPPASAPSSPADSGESTRVATTPPPIPRAPVAPPPASTAPPATQTPAAAPPPPPLPAGDFGESTIFLGDPQKLAVPVARLQRMQPPGRSDIVTLDRTHYLMGRLPSCDLRLYSQTASREHAQLTARDGRWYLTPVAGKVVLVNGTQVKEEVRLTHKMRLQLGGDELLFLDETGPVVALSAARPSDATAIRTADAGNQQRLLYLVGALLLAVLLLLWMSR